MEKQITNKEILAILNAVVALAAVCLEVFRPESQSQDS